MNPIAYSYWRRIKDKARTFDSIPDSVKEDIKLLAKNDIINEIIFKEKYKELIGEDYIL